MLLDGNSTTGSASPSLLDSPTLARVERARLRHEPGNLPLRQTACCQALLSNNSKTEREITTIKRGLLWQQRDRLFSRWKERYFILTRDYLHCFKRAGGSGADKISEMGAFIFKVKLVEVEKVEWINRKSYSTVALDVGREGRVLLRTGDGLEDWFEVLEECMLLSKERRRALRNSQDSTWQRDSETPNNNSVNSSLEEWLLARHKIAGLQQQMISDSVPDLQNRRSRIPRDRKSYLDDEDQFEDDHWIRRRSPNHEQRLSMLTDIDLNYDLQTPPSSVQSTYRGRPQSYRLNSDVFFMTPGTVRDPSDRSRHPATRVLTPVSSFRSTHMFNSPADRFSLAMSDAPPQHHKYRDRSQSDVHGKPERRNFNQNKSEASSRKTNHHKALATQV